MATLEMESNILNPDISFTLVTKIHSVDRYNVNLNLNNKRVGVIRKVDGGFAYFPGGRAKYRGETFATINDVMNDVGAM